MTQPKDRQQEQRRHQRRPTPPTAYTPCGRQHARAPDPRRRTPARCPIDSSASNAAIDAARGPRRATGAACIPCSATIEMPSLTPIDQQADQHERRTSARTPIAERRQRRSRPRRSTIQTGSVRCGASIGRRGCPRPNPDPSTRSAARNPADPASKCFGERCVGHHAHAPCRAGTRTTRSTMPPERPVTPEEPHARHDALVLLRARRRRSSLEVDLHRRPSSSSETHERHRVDPEHPRRAAQRAEQHAADHRAEHDAGIARPARPGCSPTRCPPRRRPGSGSPRARPSRNGSSAIAEANASTISDDRDVDEHHRDEEHRRDRLGDDHHLAPVVAVAQVHRRTGRQDPHDPERQQQRQRLHCHGPSACSSQTVNLSAVNAAAPPVTEIRRPRARRRTLDRGERLMKRTPADRGAGGTDGDLPGSGRDGARQHRAGDLRSSEISRFMMRASASTAPASGERGGALRRQRDRAQRLRIDLRRDLRPARRAETGASTVRHISASPPSSLRPTSIVAMLTSCSPRIVPDRADDARPVRVREEDHVPGGRHLDVEVVDLHHALRDRASPTSVPATLTPGPRRCRRGARSGSRSPATRSSASRSP